MKASTFLMFTGDAEAALSLYQQAFTDFVVGEINRHGEGNLEGKLMPTKAHLFGHELTLIDSPAVHEFGFTPSMSIFVDFDDKDELMKSATILSEGGTFRMPPDNYGFSQFFAWVDDRFGVSWQLNLP